MYKIFTFCIFLIPSQPGCSQHFALINVARFRGYAKKCRICRRDWWGLNDSETVLLEPHLLILYCMMLLFLFMSYVWNMLFSCDVKNMWEIRILGACKSHAVNPCSISGCCWTVTRWGGANRCWIFEGHTNYLFDLLDRNVCRCLECREIRVQMNEMLKSVSERPFHG